MKKDVSKCHCMSLLMCDIVRLGFYRLPMPICNIPPKNGLVSQ